jgi:hypothetical protein
MNARAVALITPILLSLLLLASTAAALDPEKRPIYSNTPGNLLCGTHSPPFSPSPCTVPAGQRLIIEHVSGYVFLPPSTDTATALQIVVTDPGLGLNGAAFHNFVATKTSGGVSDTFSFSTPFRMMLNSGATFYFSPSANVAVSGYLVKE